MKNKIQSLDIPKSQIEDDIEALANELSIALGIPKEMMAEPKLRDWLRESYDARRSTKTNQG